jgi:hypothetical protein
LPQSTLGRKTVTSGEIESESFVTKMRFKYTMHRYYKFYNYFDKLLTVITSPSVIGAKNILKMKENTIIH